MSRISAVQTIQHFRTSDIKLYNALLSLARQIDLLFKNSLQYDPLRRTLNTTKDGIRFDPGSFIFLENVIIGPGLTFPISNDPNYRYLTIIGFTKNGVLEFASNLVDGSGNIIGQINFSDKNCVTSDKIVAQIEAKLRGGSAGNRGGRLIFYTKGDNSFLVDRVEIDEFGNVELQRQGQLTSGSTDGFTYLPSTDNAPTGTPTVKTGQRAVVINNDKDKLYSYGIGSGRWFDVGLNTFRCTSDFVTSSTSLSDVTQMEFGVRANRDYYFEFYLMFESAAGGTGILLSINGPASPTSIMFDTEIQTTTQNTFRKAAARAYDAGTVTAGVDTANAICPAIVRGYLRNGANAGTVKLRLASGTGGTNVTIKNRSMGWSKEI